MRKIVLSIVGALVLGSLAAAALAAVDVQLTVRESAGIDRRDNPVNSGVPLPKGAVKDASELRLLDERGAVVLASIEPRARWPEDNSLKWVTVHFIVRDLAASGEAKYQLSSSDKPLPASPLAVSQSGKQITVVTGPAKFIVPTDKFGPFEQVFVRAEASEEFADADAMLAKPASVSLVARNGQSRVVPRTDKYKGEFKSELVKLDKDAFTQTAVVQSAAIEEKGPGRAVVALRGTFSTKENKSLDFVARLYFYANSPLAQMTFSVINRQMDGFDHFVGIDRLAVEVPVKKIDWPKGRAPLEDGEITSSIVMSGGRDKAKGSSWETCSTVEDGMRLSQLTSNEYRTTKKRLTETEKRKSEGWLQLYRGVLTAGMRWFWETHPTGLTVLPGGTACLELKDAAGERIDLYTGGAKTHFVFFEFGLPGVMQRAYAVAAGTTHPLFASCPPEWYCQQTRVFGDLYSSNPELYQPEYRDLVASFQKNVDSRLKAVVDKRARPGWKVDEFGWLNFGSGLHHSSCVREDAAESWWDGNYYDFPHAAILNFVRTGGLLSLTTAEEAGLHLADLDICHCFPGRPERAGSPRSGPVVGHFRNYTSGQTYMGHDSFTFYKNESLYELYYLTGERWYRDVGLMSSNFAMAFLGKGALRNLAHGIWGVLSAYHDTHEKKYLDRARFFVDDWGKPWQDKNNGSFKDQHWMYGLLFEAYDKYYRVSGDVKTAEYNVKALDALIAEFWKESGGTGGLDGLTVYGYGLGYEYTGNTDYFNKGLLEFKNVASPNAEGDRVKTFAQNFRSSPYFLKYLTKEYSEKKPAPVVRK